MKYQYFIDSSLSQYSNTKVIVVEGVISSSICFVILPVQWGWLIVISFKNVQRPLTTCSLTAFQSLPQDIKFNSVQGLSITCFGILSSSLSLSYFFFFTVLKKKVQKFKRRSKTLTLTTPPMISWTHSLIIISNNLRVYCLQVQESIHYNLTNCTLTCLRESQSSNVITSLLLYSQFSIYITDDDQMDLQINGCDLMNGPVS